MVTFVAVSLVILSLLLLCWQGCCLSVYAVWICLYVVENERMEEMWGCSYEPLIKTDHRYKSGGDQVAILPAEV